MNYRDYESSISLSDIILKAFFVVFVLWILAALTSNPNPTHKANVDKKAELMLTMEWDVKRDCDVDLWTRDPDGKIVSFKFREGGMVNLERDDIGKRNDTMKLADGTSVPDLENKEYIFFRGTKPGEYVVNIHLYACNKTEVGEIPQAFPLSPYISAFSYTSFPELLSVPLEVTVELDKLNPSFSTLKVEKYSLIKTWEEHTMFNFTLDSRGEVTKFDRIPTNMVTAKAQQ